MQSATGHNIMQTSKWALAANFVDARAFTTAVAERSRLAETFIQRLYLLFSRKEGAAPDEADSLFAENTRPVCLDWKDTEAAAIAAASVANLRRSAAWNQVATDTLWKELMAIAEDRETMVIAILREAVTEYVLRRRNPK